MTKETKFRRLIPDDTIKNPAHVSKLVLCTGKTYYDLEVARKERGKGEEVALVRIEQVGLMINDSNFEFDKISSPSV